MTTLIDDSKPVEQSQPSPKINIEELLAGYTSPMQVSANNIPPNGNIINPNLSKPFESTIKQAEQRFYKSGKKMGQPKPNRTGFSYNPNPVPSQPIPNQQGQPINNQLISGSLFITLIDYVFPLIIGFINNRFSKTKIDGSKLKLTDEQRKDLKPLADEAVKYMNLSANPVLLFTLSLGGLYVMNFFLQKELVELSQTKKL